MLDLISGPFASHPGPFTTVSLICGLLDNLVVGASSPEIKSDSSGAFFEVQI